MPDFHCCGEMSRRLVASGGEADPALALFMERAHGGGSNLRRERKVGLGQDYISNIPQPRHKQRPVPGWTPSSLRK